MRTTITTVFALLGLASTVIADLYIFQASVGTWEDGGPIAGDPINVFTSPPSCNDVGRAINIFSVNNDASSGGFACDGCDVGTAIVNWSITRFEMYDGPDAIGSSTSNPTGLTSGAVGHISTRSIGLLTGYNTFG
jgi:hypothetical protein